MRTLLLGVGLCLLGCSQQPQARNITGPDGTPMVHVSCGSDQSVCFQLAGRSCPGGYNLFPIFDAHDNNFLVRCQGAVAAQAAVVGSPLVRATQASSPPLPSAGAPFPTASAQREPPVTRATINDSATDFGY
jgi:hypothetical protein